jgi:sigma-54 dependent transcriptional regulator, acetoin dehydrogenase operon transcriptional activator AcoR
MPSGLPDNLGVAHATRDEFDMRDELAYVADLKLRPEIANAWRRAHISGLDPGMPVRDSEIVDIDQRSRLMQAAAPVLDAMIAELSDTHFSVLLADRDCAIVDRRLGARDLSKTLDKVMAVPGVRYVEDSTGTNSLATAYELHEPIAVTGEEHFLESLKIFCCYGAPIINPVTHRLDGVLDVTGPAAEYTALLGPFVRRAAREIEMRLIETARSAERQLLATFHEHARRKRHAVVVLSPTVVLSNPTAVDLVTGDDHSRLQSLTDGLRGPASVVRPLTLSSGSEVVVRAQPIVGTDGVLYEVVPRSSSPDRRTEQHETGRAPGAPAVVIGEPGTGRSRFAAKLGGPGAHHFDCVDSLKADTWLRDVLTVLDGDTDRAVILDDVHMLHRRAAAALTPALRKTVARVIMTSSPVDESEFEIAALTSVAIDRHELRPLRQYGPDFPDLAVSVLRELFGDHSLRIAPSTMRTLMAQPWPGNISDLRAVLSASVRDRRVGEIAVADLPDYIAVNRGGRRNLTLLEAAERDAIVKALADNGGNKSAAAAELGIGRTTLYQRLRHFNVER